MKAEEILNEFLAEERTQTVKRPRWYELRDGILRRLSASSPVSQGPRCPKCGSAELVIGQDEDGDCVDCLACPFTESIPGTFGDQIKLVALSKFFPAPRPEAPGRFEGLPGHGGDFFREQFLTASAPGGADEIAREIVEAIWQNGWIQLPRDRDRKSCETALESITREVLQAHTLPPQVDAEKVAHSIEQHMNNCFHCGTELKRWEPAIFENNKEVGREQTNHKWCTSCCHVICKVLSVYSGVNA